MTGAFVYAPAVVVLPPVSSAQTATADYHGCRVYRPL